MLKDKKSLDWVINHGGEIHEIVNLAYSYTSYLALITGRALFKILECIAFIVVFQKKIALPMLRISIFLKLAPLILS